jgi:hypothetical protein
VVKKIVIGAAGLLTAAWILRKLGLSFETFLFGPQRPEEEWAIVFKPARIEFKPAGWEVEKKP